MKINVMDFGARPDVKGVQTESLQKALDYCFLQGGGEVFIPQGEYITGALRIRSGTTLRLGANAVLKGSKDLSDYGLLGKKDDIEPMPETFLPAVHKTAGREERVKRWHNALIHIYNATGVAVIGEKGSVIDGNNVYDPDGEEGYRGPHCISVLESKNILLSGYTVKNSANWAHCAWMCKDISFIGLTVLGGHDGIDFFGSDAVKVKDCVLHTGDDCIAGFDNIGVEITDCEFNTSCNVLRFSGADVTVKGCVAYGPGEYIHRHTLSAEEKRAGALADPEKAGQYRNNTLSFLTYYADYRLSVRRPPEDILITDCKVTNCDRFLYYDYSGKDRWQAETPLKGITFSLIKAEGLKLPVYLYGDEKNPVTLEIDNCEMNFIKGEENNPLIKAANYNKITLSEVTTNGGYPAAVELLGGTGGNIIIRGGNLPTIK